MPPFDDVLLVAAACTATLHILLPLLLWPCRYAASWLAKHASRIGGTGSVNGINSSSSNSSISQGSEQGSTSFLQGILVGLNASRKSWCAVLQASHLGTVAMLAATEALGRHILSGWSIVGHALGPWDVAVPLVVVASACTVLLGVVELRRRLTSKAVALGLDEQGPGLAHPVMVQVSAVPSALE